MEKNKRRILLGVGIIVLLFLASFLWPDVLNIFSNLNLASLDSGDTNGSNLCQNSGDTGCCTPNCSGKQCGDDGCGGSCGTCVSPNMCSPLNQCVFVDGGVNHSVCDDNKKCVSVTGEGIDECEEDIDCEPTYNACNDSGQCVIKTGTKNDECQSSADCYMHAECNAQGRCVFVRGYGFDNCAEDSDCENNGGGGGAQESHYECNTEKQCVSVLGLGSDQCQTNADCQGTGGGASTNTGTDTGGGSLPVIIQQAIKSSQSVAGEVKKIIETPQGAVAAKTISTAGAVAAAAEVASFGIFSPFEIYLSLARLFGLFFAGLGLRKRVMPWGVVYDSVTKQPIDPAYVTLNDLEGKIVSSAITDLDGRYGFLTGPGTYKISVNKTNYAFPSKKLTGALGDEFYNDLYFGESFEIKEGGRAITKNIPMDSLKFDWNEFAKKDRKLMRFYSKIDIILRGVFDLFFIIGFFIAIIAYFTAPYPYNLIILSIYLILLLLRAIGIKPKAYGRIFSSEDGDPMSFAALRVILPKSNIEIAHKIADKYGRYYCLVPKGKYYVKVEKKNADGSYSLVHTSPEIDASQTGIIKKTFKI